MQRVLSGGWMVEGGGYRTQEGGWRVRRVESGGVAGFWGNRDQATLDAVAVERVVGVRFGGVRYRPAIHLHVSHTIDWPNSFRKSTPPQNRQLLVYYH